MQGFFTRMELEQSKPSLSIAPLCGVCKLHTKCQTPKMKPHGKGREKVLIVGEYPYEGDDTKGKSFSSKEGKFFREILNELDDVGILDDDVTWTNALICHPKNNYIPNPQEAYVSYCRPNLLNLIESIKPNVVILAGYIPTKSLIEYTYKSGAVEKIEDWVGWTIPDQKYNTWICPTYSVDYLLKRRKGDKDDPILRMYFKEHLRKAFSLRKSKPWEKVPNYAKQVRILNDSEVEKEVKYFCTEPDDGIVAFDYETNMLKPDSRESAVRCVSLSDGKNTVAFDLNSKTSPHFVRFLQSDAWKVASNLIFEDRWSRRIYGTKVKNWLIDTAISSHVLDNRSRITSIKFQAYVLLGQPDYSSHLEEYLRAKVSGCYSKNRVFQADRRELLLYCGLDSLLELLVARKHMEELQFFGTSK